MKIGFYIYFFLIPVACIVFLDELIKFQAIQTFPDISTILQPKFVEFAIHKNFGLVFNIPFRLEFVIAISILIGLLLVRVLWKNGLKRPEISFPVLLILIGASGNFLDRILYGFTIDYMIFFGRSAINFSDMIIVLGVISLLLFSSKRKNLTKNEIVIK